MTPLTTGRIHTARLLVGDVFERMGELPDGSVDLVLTSPPFLALRSYLPKDHPDKHQEIGSEATPAEYLDVLLQLTAEWGRVLAPHGSLCVELGDVYAGSGGAGGDYDDDGWRGGQPRFGGSASKTRESRWSVADALWMAGVIDTEGSIIVHRQDRGGNAPSYRTDVCVSMMDRQVCDRAAEIAGVGNVNRDGRDVYSWHVSAQQARYVLVNIWPHLLIKKRQAMAAIELQRHIEEFRGRGTYSKLTTDVLGYREMIREFVSGLNARGEDRGKYVPTWLPPTPPRVQHEERRSVGWPLSKSLCGIPQLYGIALAYGINPLTGDDSPAGRWRVRNLVAWVRPNPPVGALGDKYRPATSYVTVATRARGRWFDLDAVRTPSGYHRESLYTNKTTPPGQRPNGSQHTTNPAGAPPLDWWEIPPGGYSGAHYAVWPKELCRRLIDSMCPRRVCTTCGQPSRRLLGDASYVGSAGLPVEAGGKSWHSHGDGAHRGRTQDATGTRREMTRVAPTTGWSSCGCPDTDSIRLDGFHTGQGWRPGVVLDPFVGSGTTLAVASGMGRDSIGIDLDSRNADLARERVGMFLDIDEGSLFEDGTT